MRVLVTGAGGFLGGHIARRLAESGFEVVATTRVSPAEPPRSEAAARRFATLQTDFSPGTLPLSVDAIVHAAATSAWSGISVDRMLTDNILATQAVVRHAIAAKVSAFVLFSSVSAFGTIRTPVLDETHSSIDVDTYGATKLLGEQLLRDAAAALPSLAIRLPAVVGRRSSRNWPSECLRKLKADARIEIFNPDAPFNNVVHESDVALLIAAALERGLSGAEMVVIGSAGQTTIAGAIGILAAAAGKSPHVTTVKRDSTSFLIDSRKAARLFDFAPLPVEAALRRFVEDNA